MTSNPDEIRHDIEQTRADLADDVDALHAKVSPTAIAGRKVDSAKAALGSAKDKVMGASGGVGDAGGAVAGKVSAVGSTLTSAAAEAPAAAQRQTRGNPLAAGLVAFGAGWLVSSLLPASQPEKQAAGALSNAASEHSDVLIEPAKQAAQDVAQNLKEPAQRAADSVKQTAADAASTVKDAAGAAKDDMVDAARSDSPGGSGSSTRAVGDATSRTPY